MKRHTHRLQNLLSGIAVPTLLGTMACPTTLPPTGSADAGVQPPSSVQDGGTPAPTDAGPGPDAGPPPPDTGAPDAGPVPDDTIDLKGTLKDGKYVAPRPAQGVTATVFNADCNRDGFIDNDDRTACTATAGPDGSYAVEDLAPGSVLVVSINRPGETCAFESPTPACGANHFSTVMSVNTGTDPEAVTDLYSVGYQWVLDQAVRCKAAPTLAQAGTDLVIYSSVLGTIRDANGAPKAGVRAADVAVDVNGFANESPSTCFLEAYNNNTPDDTSDDYFRVALDAQDNPLTQSTSTGKFIVFKTRNSAGNGSGAHTVNVAGVGSAVIPLNAGKLGVVSIKEGESAVPVQAIIDFETEILDVFERNGCVACHRPGGTGFVAPTGLNDYYLNLTRDSPDEAYRAIVGPSAERSRIDLDLPEESLLITMPLYEDPPNHPNASFESLDDPDAQLVMAWVAQGAPRGARVTPPPVNTYATLSDIIEISIDIGCSNCHAGGRNANGALTPPRAGMPYGGVPLDGCIPYFEYPAGYGPSDTTLAPSDLSPRENQRCVYWHLVKEVVDHEPYYGSQPDNDGNGTAGEPSDGRRVNIIEPEKSQLIRNPYCGNDEDGDGIGEACEDAPNYPEDHFSQVFFGTDDPAYELFLSWVEGGAKDDGVNGAPTP